MQSDPGQLWQAALKDLAQQVSRANFDTFLDGTEGLRLNEDVLSVGTRSEFVDRVAAAALVAFGPA